MKTEKVSASIFLVGFIFPIMHWPGAGPLIVFSLSIMAVLYFPFAFYFFCDKQIKRQNPALSIISGLFLSFIPIGLMFKILYWPGAQQVVIIGLISALIIFAVINYLKKKAPEDLLVYYKNMMQRTLVLLILSIVLFITPQSALISIQNWDDPELARLKTQHFAYPQNEDYTQQYKSYLMKRDSLYHNNAK